MALMLLAGDALAGPMQSDGVQHLLTTVKGWMLSDTNRLLLMGTGIALLPLLGTIFDHVRDVRERGSAETLDADQVLSGLEVKLVVMALVIFFAFLPSSGARLSSSSLVFTETPSVTSPDAVLRTPTDSGSPLGETLDRSGSADFISEGVDIPRFWFAVMAVSQGVKYAMLQEFGRDGEAYRTIRSILARTSIANPEIRNLVNILHTNCYLPARAEYRDGLNLGDGTTPITPVPADATVVGPDITYIGNPIFTGSGGAYEEMRVPYPVSGFAWNRAVDTEYTSDPGAGAPKCSELWTRIKVGIREESQRSGLYDELKAGKDFMDRLTGNADPTDDEIAKLYLSQVNPQVSLTADQIAAIRRGGGDPGALRSAIDFAAGVVQGLKLAPVAAGMELGLDMLIQGLVFSQAHTLMIVYWLIPLGLVISRYSLSFCFGAAVLIFGLNFFSVLWASVAWLDASMAEALWDGQNYWEVFVESGPNEVVKRMMHAFVIGVLYLGVTSIMGVIVFLAGSRAGMMGQGLISPGAAASGGATASGSMWGRAGSNIGQGAAAAGGRMGNGLYERGRAMLGR